MTEHKDISSVKLKLEQNLGVAKSRETQLLDKTVRQPDLGPGRIDTIISQNAAENRRKVLEHISEGRATTIQHARDMVARELMMERDKRSLDEKTLLFRSKTYPLHQEYAIQEYMFGRRSHFSELKMDFDKFSWFNDLINDKFGDMVLSALGKYLVQVRRSGDVGVRKGGEELHFLFNYNSGEKSVLAASRLMSNIRQGTLPTVLEILKDGPRVTNIQYNGKKYTDREGSVLLRNFARAILERKSDGGLSRFLTTGKGVMSQKLEIVRKFEQFASSGGEHAALLKYAFDERPKKLLKDDELTHRIEMEGRVVSFLSTLFGEVTASGGMVVYGPDDRDSLPPAESVTADLAELTHKSKSAGRSYLTVRHGNNRSLRTFEVT